ncbi:MAG: c-type cytochrome [Saprospiraceae bacterium]|nr:c-type cytochrome [Saprospiraceae bacterium]
MKYAMAFLLAALLTACASDSQKKEQSVEEAPATEAQPGQANDLARGPESTPPPQANPTDVSKLNIPEEAKEKIKNLKPQAHNEGKEPILIRGVNLTFPVRRAMVAHGKTVYDQSCASCHALTGDRIKASGFSGITKRRKPEWIMNMITGVATKLETDAAKAAKLEQCPTRKADTRLNIVQARDFLEMLRMNDGEKMD